MHTRQNIEKANRLIKSFPAKDLIVLKGICNRIQLAQENFLQYAAEYFDYCHTTCKGLCCRNIHVSHIVTLLDFIYILVLDRGLLPPMRKAADRERLFPANCLFLRNRAGPCMFGPTSKPERCILTFCQDLHPLRPEIKAIRRGFNHLSRFIIFRKPLVWFGF